MNWIYLSPHLDDIALSCGGLVWEQVQEGHVVEIWTICAGDAPEDTPAAPLSDFARAIHLRWQTSDPQFRIHQAPAHRRQEDLASCAVLGAAARHFSLPDCIYRRALVEQRRALVVQRRAPGERHRAPAPASSPNEFLYASEEALWTPLHPAETPLVQALSAELAAGLPEQAEIVCPLSIGGHVDHRLTRAAAELLHRPLWYYADYPYAAQQPEALAELRQAGWNRTCQELSEQAQQAWDKAVAAHASQISTFWSDLEQMKAALRAFARGQGGGCLWRAP